MPRSGHWVAEGAAYEPHWAYSAPVRPETPAAASPTASAHPIDRFVDATLARERLTAAPAADRRTLLRRLSLDLTGQTRRRGGLRRQP